MLSLGGLKEEEEEEIVVFVEKFKSNRNSS
jgi:hypothetical protein